MTENDSKAALTSFGATEKRLEVAEKRFWVTECDSETSLRVINGRLIKEETPRLTPRGDLFYLTTYTKSPPFLYRLSSRR